jgi:hypothetical protein
MSYDICAWIIRYMFLVQFEGIKNQPSNSVSCTYNVLRLLVLVPSGWYWGFQVTSLFSIRGCIWKGCVWERCIFEGPDCVWRALKDLNNGAKNVVVLKCTRWMLSHLLFFNELLMNLVSNSQEFNAPKYVLFGLCMQNLEGYQVSLVDELKPNTRTWC